MDVKCLKEQLDIFRNKEREYVALAQQASGAVQVLEHLVTMENKDLPKDN